MSLKKPLSTLAVNRAMGEEGTYRAMKPPTPEAQLTSHLVDEDDVDPQMDTYDLMMRQLPDPWTFEDDQ